MITSIVTGFLVTAAGLYIYDKLRVVPVKKQYPKEQSWAEAQIERDKLRQVWEDEMLNNRYRRDIEFAAQDDYDWWLNRKPFDILKPFRGGRMITVGHNHREVFPKSFEEYVQEEFERIKSERHTLEEIKQIEHNQKKAFYDAMHMEMPEEESI